MLIQTQPILNFSSSLYLALTEQSFYEAYCWVVFPMPSEKAEANPGTVTQPEFSISPVRK